MRYFAFNFQSYACKYFNTKYNTIDNNSTIIIIEYSEVDNLHLTQCLYKPGMQASLLGMRIFFF